MKKILLGITGGIAAYKMPELVRLYLKEDCQIKTVMTETAGRFVTRDAMASLTGDTVFSGLFEPIFQDAGHTELAKWADVFVIAPATANTVAKLALGISDNLLTSTYLASTAQKLIIPSMNTDMYENPIVQKNLKALRAAGAEVLVPDVGDLACKTYGVGRMPDPEVIVEATLRAAGPQELKGKRVVVTAGATEEEVDDVRIITNKSTGLMGVELARQAYRMGADVTILAARLRVSPPPLVVTENGTSLSELKKLYTKYASKADYFIATAAVGDFVPETKKKGKIERSTKGLEIKMKPSTDLVAFAASKKKKSAKVIGFAAEASMNEKRAKEKMTKKKLDGIFLNPITAMGSTENEGRGLSKSSVKKFKKQGKSDLASEFWEWAVTV